MPEQGRLELKAVLTGIDKVVQQLNVLTKSVDASTKQMAQTTQSIETGFKKVQSSSRAAQQGMKNAKAASTEFNDELLKLGRTMASFAAVFYTLKNLFGVFGEGIKFNKIIEDSRLSVSGLLSSLYEYKNATGEVATGIQAFNYAQKDATKLQTDLRIAALETEATYEELLFALQNSVLPATQAGLKFEQLGTFVQRFAQIMPVSRVPMNQINEEVRSFLQGTMQPRMTRVMPFMLGLGLTNDKIKELIRSGKFAEEFFKRTWAVELMASEGAKTFSVSLSNLKDAFQQAMGLGTTQLFEKLKTVFLDLTGYIVQIDKATKTISFNPDFLSQIKEIDTRLVRLIDRVRSFAKSFSELTGEYPTTTKTIKEVGDLVLNIAALLYVLKLGKGLISWLVSGLLEPFKGLYNYIYKLGPWFMRLLPFWKLVVIAMVAFAIYEFGGLIKKLLKIFWDWIGSFPIYGLTIKDWASEATTWIIERFREVGIDVPKFFQKIVADLKKVKEEIDRILPKGKEPVPLGSVEEFNLQYVNEQLGQTENRIKSLIEAERDLKDATTQLEGEAAYFAISDKAAKDAEAELWNLDQLLLLLGRDAYTFFDTITFGLVSAFRDAGKKLYDALLEKAKQAIDEVKNFFPLMLEVGIKLIMPEGEWINVAQWFKGEMSKAKKGLEAYGIGGAPPVATSTLGRRGYTEAAGEVPVGIYERAGLTPGTAGGLTVPKKYTPFGGLEGRPLDEYSREAKNLGLEAGKGKGKGGGRSEETEARRLMGIYDRVMQDIARLSEGRLSDIRENEKRTINDIMKYKEQKELTEADVIEATRRRTLLQMQKAEEDYAIWSGKISGDVTQEWIANARKEYQAWKGFKDVKARITQEFTRKVTEYNMKQLTAVNEAQDKYLSAASKNIPLLSDQLQIQEKQLEIQNEQAMRKIEEQRLNGEIGKETAETLRMLQLQTTELEKQALERQKWMTEGAFGGLKTWAYQRVGESEQSGAKTMIEWMGSLETTTTDSLAAGIVGALSATREDFAKTGRDIAQAFMEKSIALITSKLFDQLAMVVLQAFGLAMPTAQSALLTASQGAATTLSVGALTAGNNLFQGGLQAAQAMVAGSQIAAQNLGGKGGGGGVLGGLFGGLFKGMIGGPEGPTAVSSMGGLMTVPPFHFQHGGIAMEPTLGLIAESRPEAVIPLDQLGAVLGNAGGGGGVNVTVNNNTGTPADADVKFDGKNLEITLSRLVSRNISRGGDIHRAINRSFDVQARTQRR